MAHPLDEYPIHQAPVSMAYTATSDRNFYDRCIFHVVPHDDDMQLITGMGVYPNLGVIDAYASVRCGRSQHVVRTSDELGEDRMAMSVGPISLTVIEPLHRLRMECAGGPGEVGFELEWTAAVPVIDEPQHLMRRGPQTILDASRFAGTGTWEGTVRAGGQSWDIDPRHWSGTRDRSWGIRPSGAALPKTRFEEAAEPTFWWVWAPLRFDGFSIMVIAQEDGDGHRLLGEAVRMWPVGSGRRPEQLGWPELEIRYRSGTRQPVGATIHLTERDRSAVTVEVETRGGMPLNVGCGYGPDPDWSHGQWRGPDWTERVVYDLDDVDVAARVPFAVIDHVATATVRAGGVEHVGHGIFEHSSIGRHDPSGFADLFSVAD